MMSENNWHTLPVEKVLAELDTSAAGLDEHEARERLARHGANRLPEAPKRSLLVRFLLQFHNILIYVLIGAAVITALLDHWADTVVILAVVIANVKNRFKRILSALPLIDETWAEPVLKPYFPSLLVETRSALDHPLANAILELQMTACSHGLPNSLRSVAST